MKTRLISGLVTLLLVSCLVIFRPAPAPGAAEGPGDFYRDKNMIIVVTFSPGGGTDMMTRALAPYVKKEMGLGAAIVENRRGGGGLEGMNYMYKVAKPDALTIGVTTEGMISNYLLGAPGVGYSITGYKYIGLVCPFEMALYVQPKYRSVKDLQAAKGLIFGGIGPLDPPTTGGALVIDILGLDAKLVPGFRGTGPLILATMKREIDGFVTAPAALFEPVRKGEFNRLCTLGTEQSNIVPEPPITKLAPVTGGKQELLELYGSIQYGYYIIGPPGTPKDRLEYLRSVLKKICATNKIQKDLATVIKYWSGCITGDKLEDIVNGNENMRGDMQKIKLVAEKYIVR